MRKPRARDYHTDDGMHAAMKNYCAHHSVKGVLVVTCTFDDGSGGVFDCIERALEPVTYKTRDGELWEEPRATSKFAGSLYADGKPATRKEMERLVTEWLNRDEPVPTSIAFTIELE